ncbi:MAG: hypothetical protein LC627_06240, partial [Verrucomicrobiaceae bacterium]|nr:hypothetical protein [Verrucomicrobiaceae bacterium]
ITVAVHPDGSRTTFEFDNPNRTAVATTTGSDGKVREKIQYTLNQAGQFATGVAYGPDEQFRFKSTYKYDESRGRLLEETQMNKAGAVLHRIVYKYDQAGKQLGYSVLDANGKLVSETGARPPSAVHK